MKNEWMLAGFFLLMLSCKNPETPSATPALIPLPGSVQYVGGSFKITDATAIQVSGEDPEVQKIAAYLGSWLKTGTGLALPVSVNKGDTSGIILLSLNSSDSTLGEEGYTLTVGNAAIRLSAFRPAGLFRGVQTLRQLLPASMESPTPGKGPWEVAACNIRDTPEYGYRGSMLDVARHFFSVEDVKRYIDLIALYKMNVLHLHLSDDQGWRIEIKSWPRLTEYGGSTQVGGGKGGFYTQEQYKDIVQYAADRYVTIIPEIDMPGHTNAALASYPGLNCRDTTYVLYSGTEVGFSTLCTTRDSTYLFVEDVIRELAAITPGPYLHIGGDESHVTPKDEYITFMNRVQPIVSKYGKKVIGWDEIAHATLQPNTIVQFWSNETNSKMAVSKGARVIMSPAKKTYLDMQYDSTTRLGLHWAAFIEVDSSYAWDPANYVTGIGKENIVGVEAPLWTETISKMDDIEYMVFPRLPGLAEVGWSSPANRNWTEYRQRLAQHGSRFKALGIDYYPSKQVDWK